MRYSHTEIDGNTVKIFRDQIGLDGQLIRHVSIIPRDCLSIRAGEYGLDPIDDAETVLDILLHENDEAANPPGETIPPITSATTLEEARGIALERCRKARDGHHAARRAKGARPSKEEDIRHVEVLESIPGLFLQDRQLAELSRIHMKAAVWAERERQSMPPISHKARMIDEIRQREGV